MYRFLFLAIVLGMLFLIIFVNGLGFLRLLSSFFEVNKKIYWIVFVLFQVLMICTFMISNKYINAIGNYYIGFSAYYFMINLVVMLVILLPISVFKEVMFIKILESLKIFLIIILLIYGTYNAQNIIITEYELISDKIEKDMHIVIFSDLHLGKNVGLKEVEQLVSKVNDLDPDVILIIGDFFDNQCCRIKDIDKISAEFRKLKSVYGVYTILGNHDLYTYYDGMVEFFEKTDITLLEDSNITIGDINLIGRKDFLPNDKWNHGREPVASLVKDVNKDEFIIMMDHQANGQSDAIKNNVDLIISGHTHNGQIFPGNLIVAMINKVGYGHKRYDNTDVIVTSGIGYWGPPIRIGSNSEIVSLRVRANK